MSRPKTRMGDDGARQTTTRSRFRNELKEVAKGMVCQLRNAFSSGVSLRLDAHPQGTHSDLRTRLVLGFLDESGVADALYERLRIHPGDPCSYPPILVLAAVILAVMSGRNAEITDALAALNALPPLLRLKHGVHDKHGFFVSYDSFFHQLGRVTRLLHDGFTDSTGFTWTTEVLINRLLQISPTTNEGDVRAVAVDGYAIETWARSRVLSPSYWLDVQDGLLQGQTTDESPEQEWAPLPSRPFEKRRKWDKTIVTTKSKKRQTICRDPGARYGYRTETTQQKGEFIMGLALHLAAEIPEATYQGDPSHITIGEQGAPRIVGAALRPLNYSDGPAGVELMTQVKEAFPTCAEGVFDRGYSKSSYKNFRGPLNELGVNAVLMLDEDDFARVEDVEVPLKRRGPGGEVLYESYLSTAGTLLHKQTPKELLHNPKLPRSDKPERAEVEAFYAKRSAFSPPIHERLEGGAQRRRCPVHAGRLRPLDVLEAASANLLEKPSLRNVEGVTECCCQEVVEVPAELLGNMHQNVPFGTPAWSKTYGRRPTVESMNALLRTNLQRIDRGFCRTLDPVKYELLYGLALVAINLMIHERMTIDEVEVVEVGEPHSEFVGSEDDQAPGDVPVGTVAPTAMPPPDD